MAAVRSCPSGSGGSGEHAAVRTSPSGPGGSGSSPLTPPRPGCAERRVLSAVRLAADGPAGTVTETGLGGLHEAMWSGRLDAYRASVVTTELDEAPPEVRATVVAALESRFDTEDASHLRRRCRRVLARISPDLLRQKAVRVRAESSLRRWADEPGVDRWEGTFPSRPGTPRPWLPLLPNLPATSWRLPGPATLSRRSSRAGGSTRSSPTGTWPRPRRATRSPGPSSTTPRAGMPTRRPGPTTGRRWRQHPGGSPRDPGLETAHSGRLPTLPAAGPAGARPRPALPLPRVLRRRGLLRPRPRATLAGRAHHGPQPHLPVPAPSPHQATARVAGDACRRRHRDLDRSHRPDPHHGTRRRPGRRRAQQPCRPVPHSARRRCRRRCHEPAARRGARRAARHPRVPPRAPGCRTTPPPRGPARPARPAPRRAHTDEGPPAHRSRVPPRAAGPSSARVPRRRSATLLTHRMFGSGTRPELTAPEKRHVRPCP